MLIEFRVANFRSILEQQTVSMVADKGAEHRETHTFETGISKFDRLVASAAIAPAAVPVVEPLQHLGDVPDLVPRRQRRQWHSRR